MNRLKNLGRRLFGKRAPTPELPVVAPAPPSPPFPEELANALPLRKVLIVDDDAVILKTTAVSLTAAGYKVFTAVDAAEALNVIGEERPDFVLIDLEFPPDVAHGGVPAWDGFRLMSWLRGLANTKGVPLMIITGSEPKKFEARARELGAVAFFQKPIDHHRLLETLAAQGAGNSETTPAAGHEVLP